jgi:hypothetical protein
MICDAGAQKLCRPVIENYPESLKRKRDPPNRQVPLERKHLRQLLVSFPPRLLVRIFPFLLGSGTFLLLLMRLRLFRRTLVLRLWHWTFLRLRLRTLHRALALGFRRWAFMLRLRHRPLLRLRLLSLLRRTLLLPWLFIPRPFLLLLARSVRLGLRLIFVSSPPVGIARRLIVSGSCLVLLLMRLIDLRLRLILVSTASVRVAGRLVVPGPTLVLLLARLINLGLRLILVGLPPIRRGRRLVVARTHLVTLILPTLDVGLPRFLHGRTGFRRPVTVRARTDITRKRIVCAVTTIAGWRPAIVDIYWLIAAVLRRIARVRVGLVSPAVAITLSRGCGSRSGSNPYARGFPVLKLSSSHVRERDDSAAILLKIGVLLLKCWRRRRRCGPGNDSSLHHLVRRPGINMMTTSQHRLLLWCQLRRRDRNTCVLKLAFVHAHHVTVNGLRGGERVLRGYRHGSANPPVHIPNVVVFPFVIVVIAFP